ncbi:MAG: pyrroline-5-carboxylate reductase [Alphaproteobacteria bacterium]|nr:pyrroline-5-carboxylate reductase [Alphaproteobacteria bacterium]
MSAQGPLLLVGGGKMGGAMVAGWLARGMKPADVAIVETDAERARGFKATAGLIVAARAEDVPASFKPSVVVLAVKPQSMDAVAPLYRRHAGPGCVFLSIAAGKTIGYFQRHLGAEAAVVRSMPNTPAAVGRGITVACANARVSAAQRAACDELLKAVGEVAWVADEALLDAVTAVSGGGPAYVFLLAESLAAAGVAVGLPADLAARLARVTVAGAGELLHRAAESPATLRQNVTSPQGTTERALAVLMGPQGWQPLLDKAIAAATKRSKELSG